MIVVSSLIILSLSVRGWSRSGVEVEVEVRSGLDQKQNRVSICSELGEWEECPVIVPAISLPLPRFVVCFVGNHFNLM